MKGYEIYSDRLEMALDKIGYPKGATKHAAARIGRSPAYFTTTFSSGRIGGRTIEDIDKELHIPREIYVKVFADKAQQDLELMRYITSGDDEEIDAAMRAVELFPEDFKVYQRSAYEGAYAALVDFFKNREGCTNE